MTRFKMGTEKLVGSRAINYTVIDTNDNSVLVRYADKKEAEGLVDRLNKSKMESEDE